MSITARWKRGALALAIAGSTLPITVGAVVAGTHQRKQGVEVNYINRRYAVRRLCDLENYLEANRIRCYLMMGLGR